MPGHADFAIDVTLLMPPRRDYYAAYSRRLRFRHACRPLPVLRVKRHVTRCYYATIYDAADCAMPRYALD